MSVREIVVAKDGSSEYDTIASALDAAGSATPARPVEVIVKEGVYEETLTTRDWVNLTGVDRDSCVIRFHGGDGDGSGKQVISATSNTTLRNLTVIGIQVKYSIHSDGGGAYALKLENCVIRREYPEEYPRTHVKACGIGLHGGQHIVMVDCRVEAELPVYLHNYPNEPGPCSMTLEGCALKGKECAVDVFLLGSKQRDYLVVHDSVLDAAGIGIQYRNARDVAWAPAYHGESEMELVGSGNRLVGISGATMRDDSQDRRSGIEIAQGNTSGAI